MANTFVNQGDGAILNDYMGDAAIAAAAILSTDTTIARLCNDPRIARQFSDKRFAKGEEVKIRHPGRVVAQRLAASTTAPPAATDHTDQETSITIDEVLFHSEEYSSLESTVDFNSLLDTFVIPSARALAEQANYKAGEMAKDIYNHVGTAGTDPTAFSEITAIRNAMNKADIPEFGRLACLSNDAYNAISNIELFHTADKSGTTQGFRTGQVADSAGFSWFESRGIVEHTVGTMRAQSPAVNGTVAEGATSMAVDGGVGTETLKHGDLFTVAGSPGQYVFTEDKTASGGVIASITFSPAAPAGGFADTSGITLVDSHTKNICWYPGAMIYVSPKYSRGDGDLLGGGDFKSYTDPEGFFSVSIHKDRSNPLAEEISMLSLAGAKCVRPDMAFLFLT